MSWLRLTFRNEDTEADIPAMVNMDRVRFIVPATDKVNGACLVYGTSDWINVMETVEEIEQEIKFHQDDKLKVQVSHQVVTKRQGQEF